MREGRQHRSSTSWTRDWQPASWPYTEANLAALAPTTQSEITPLPWTLVVGELRKRVSRSDERVTSGRWHTNDGDKIDFVIELDAVRVLAFEVKSNERVRGEDLGGYANSEVRSAIGSSQASPSESAPGPSPPRTESKSCPSTASGDQLRLRMRPWTRSAYSGHPRLGWSDVRGSLLTASADSQIHRGTRARMGAWIPS